jgi:hypothetical protein
MYIRSRFLVTGVLVLFMSPAIPVSTIHSESISREVELQTAVTIAPFSAVELRNGGKVFIRHGATQRVTLLKGVRDYTHVKIAGGDRLVIDKCRSNCPRGYELEVEIVTPDIASISIADGGTIEVQGSFPGRAEIRVAVTSGGTIDIRSMSVESVTASVDQGGKIFTKPQSAMTAAVRHGGNITYWGDAKVVSSIRDGGVVIKGSADDADKPLSHLGSSFQDVPPIPPLPPIPVQRVRPVN